MRSSEAANARAHGFTRGHIGWNVVVPSTQQVRLNDYAQADAIDASPRARRLVDASVPGFASTENRARFNGNQRRTAEHAS